MTDPTQPMTPPPPADKAPGSGRWIKIALAVSLAINLGVAGVVAGSALKFRRDGGDRVASRDLAFGPYTEALSRDQRRDMMRKMTADGPGLREIQQELRADLDAVLLALRSDPFDADSFRRALEAQSNRLSRRVDDGRRALVDLVAAMSDAERADFARQLEQRVKKRRPPRD
ncbi:periplasmic heavy metal sensor [Pseudotabrizicola sp. L79]|uniref:periplasmic heavy metal sensor n=1 Tax=Pseudotabrizicola sp. L79 TaxID=3118402 RepID=UPI002F923EFD